MGIKLHEKDIGEYRFLVKDLPAKKAFSILPLVVEAAGGAIAAMDAEQVDSASVGAALSSLARSLDGDKFERIVNAMASATRVRMRDSSGDFILKDLKSEAVQDEVFSGDMATFFGWLSFALGVNFGSFFDGRAVDSLFGGLAAAEGSKD